jgi:hypothetical protein
MAPTIVGAMGSFIWEVIPEYYLGIKWPTLKGGEGESIRAGQYDGKPSNSFAYNNQCVIGCWR